MSDESKVGLGSLWFNRQKSSCLQMTLFSVVRIGSRCKKTWKGGGLIWSTRGSQEKDIIHMCDRYPNTLGQPSEIIGSATKKKKSCVEMDQQLLAQVELHPLTSSFK